MSDSDGHLMLNLHPLGGLAGLGGSPVAVILPILLILGNVYSVAWIDERSSIVYGCFGDSKTSSTGPLSTILPRYI